jgi:hypothetical protein
MFCQVPKLKKKINKNKTPTTTTITTTTTTSTTTTIKNDRITLPSNVISLKVQMT